MERESMEYDVVVVGGGPAGLAAAIRFRQLCLENDVDLSVVVVEKGSEIGAHILSGAVIDPIALDELIPDWKEKGAPTGQEAGDDSLLYLTEKRSFPLPTPPIRPLPFPLPLPPCDGAVGASSLRASAGLLSARAVGPWS